LKRERHSLKRCENYVGVRKRQRRIGMKFIARRRIFKSTIALFGLVRFPSSLVVLYGVAAAIFSYFSRMFSRCLIVVKSRKVSHDRIINHKSMWIISRVALNSSLSPWNILLSWSLVACGSVVKSAIVIIS